MRVSDMKACDPFARIKALDATGYAAAFGETNPDTLDSRFVLQFGEREVSPTAIDATGAFRDFAINGVWLTYRDKWQRYAELFGLQYDVLKPYSLQVDYSKTYKTDDATTRTSSESDKVSGFDSDSLVDSSATSGESTTGDKRNQTTTTTRTTTGHQSGRMVSDLIQGDLDLHRQMFFGIVLNDMKGELTLSIYD